MRRLLYAFFLAALIFSSPDPQGITISFPKTKIQPTQDLNEEDQMDLAVQQEMELTKDPQLGYVPHERLMTAIKYAEDQKNSGTRGAISGIVWKERGPNNVSGRTQAILIDPNDATKKTVFAGGIGGGLWKCSDVTASTTTWTPVNDLLANLAISTLAYNPANTQVMYMGTGEGWYNVDAIRGDGIFKSTDGGTTWTQLSSTTGSDFDYVQKIVVSSAGDVYAATRSASSGGGIFKSTDAGSTWTKVLYSGNGASTDRCADLEIAADNTIYAAMGIFTTDGIYKSTTGNSGSWTKLNTGGNGFPTTGFYRCEIACAPSSAATLYVLTEATSNGGLYNIYKSTNSGSTWSTSTKPTWNDGSCSSTSNDFTRTQAWYDLIAAVDPNNANNVFIGGVDIFKTTNGGTSWTQLTSWWGGCSRQYIHADQHAIIFEPANSNIVYFGNDGGVFRTSDAGSTFSNKGFNYNVTQYYGCAMNPTAYNNQFLSGAQDNGTQQYSSIGVNSTLQVVGGDGAYCHIDQDQSSYQFASYVFLNIYRSSDGGSSWSNIVANSNVGNFVNPSDYDNTNNVLYFNYGNPYAGTNYDTYGRILNATTSSTVSTVSISSASGGSYITHVSVSPVTSNRVFFGTSNGRVIRVNSANATPTVSLIGTPVSGSPVSCIAIDNANDSHLLVTYSSYGVNSVWETTNGGTSWTSVEGNLPDMPVWWALFNPSNNTQALIATEVGVWSTDALSAGSTSWSSTNTGLPNVSTRMLQIRSSDNLVIAATHGRGLFSSDIFTTAHADFAVNRTITYVGATLQFTDNSYKGTSWNWSFGDATTSTTQNPTKTYSAAGFYSVTLSINSGASSLTKTNYIQVLPNKGTPYIGTDGGNFDVNPDNFGSEIIAGTGFQRGNSSVSGKNGTYNGNYAWVTGLTGNYVDNSSTYLYTPNYNFTATGTYIISFYSKYSVESNYDGFRLEYSLDKGSTWNLLGTTGGTWYNYANSTGVTAWPLGEPFFSGSNANYTNHQYATSALQNNANVAFRIGFKSDGGVTGTGVAIDNFEIQGPTNIILPIELVSFTGINQGDKNILNWRTESELNNEGFDVERSVNTRDWETIGFVKGSGTSNTPHDYSFSDHDIQQPFYYYRLKQHDYESTGGKTSYSNVVYLANKSVTEFSAAITPNIFSRTFTVNYSNASESSLRMRLFSLSGEIIFEKSFSHEDAYGTINVDIEKEIPAGVYLLRFESGNLSSTQKLVKQ